jgi:DNA-directed RNA polymerase subunit RPC12/RpoP
LDDDEEGEVVEETEGAEDRVIAPSAGPSTRLGESVSAAGAEAGVGAVSASEETYECPDCGAELGADDTVCSSCGAEFEDDEEDEYEDSEEGTEEESKEKDEDEGFECPDCGADLGADDTVCSSCGAEFED